MTNNQNSNDNSTKGIIAAITIIAALLGILADGFDVAAKLEPKKPTTYSETPSQPILEETYSKEKTEKVESINENESQPTRTKEAEDTKLTKCTLRIIDLNCLSTTCMASKDEIRIWINGERIGEKYYSISEGDTKAIGITVDFENAANIKLKEVDTFNDDELGERVVTCSDKGIKTLNFSGGVCAKYTLTYEILYLDN